MICPLFQCHAFCLKLFLDILIQLKWSVYLKVCHFFLLTPLLISSFNNYRFNETYYIGLVLLWSRRISRFGTFQVTYAGDFVSNNIVCFVIKFVKYYIRFSFKDMMFTLTNLTLDVSSMRAGKSN